MGERVVRLGMLHEADVELIGLALLRRGAERHRAAHRTELRLGLVVEPDRHILAGEERRAAGVQRLVVADVERGQLWREVLAANQDGVVCEWLGRHRVKYDSTFSDAGS